MSSNTIWDKISHEKLVNVVFSGSTQVYAWMPLKVGKSLSYPGCLCDIKPNDRKYQNKCITKYLILHYFPFISAELRIYTSTLTEVLCEMINILCELRNMFLLKIFKNVYDQSLTNRSNCEWIVKVVVYGHWISVWCVTLIKHKSINSYTKLGSFSF